MDERFGQLFLHYGMALFVLVPFVAMLFVTIRAKLQAREIRARESRDEAAFYEVYEADLKARRYAFATGTLGAAVILAVALTLFGPTMVSNDSGSAAQPLKGRQSPNNHGAPHNR